MSSGGRGIGKHAASVYRVATNRIAPDRSGGRGIGKHAASVYRVATNRIAPDRSGGRGIGKHRRVSFLLRSEGQGRSKAGQAS